jgi:hypothetical protein
LRREFFDSSREKREERKLPLPKEEKITAGVSD